MTEHASTRGGKLHTNWSPLGNFGLHMARPHAGQMTHAEIGCLAAGGLSCSDCTAARGDDAQFGDLIEADAVGHQAAGPRA